MVKHKKNMMKKISKLNNKQATGNLTNKVMKKRLNAEKKVKFQKQVLLQDAIETRSPLVESVVLKSALKKSTKTKEKPQNTKRAVIKKRSVEKKKQRRKTSLSDAKLLKQIMNNN